MDVRAHFELGGRTIEALDSARIVGPSQVVDVTGIEGHVERADLEAVSRTEQERALLEPRNSLAGPMEKEGCPEIPKGAAEYLVELGVETVGVAYLSVEPFEDEELKKHQKLLGADLVTPEGLVLRDVGPGDYLPACLPLKLEGSGGSPAWAVLVSDPQGGHA
jgi:kynurenine formamidase